LSDDSIDDIKSSALHLAEPLFHPNQNGFYVLRTEGQNTYDRLTNFHCKVIKEIIYEGIRNTSVFTIWAGIPVSVDKNEKYTYVAERTLEVKSKDFHKGTWIQELGGEYIVFPLQKFPATYINMIAQTWRPEMVIQKICQVIGYKETNQTLVYVSGNDIVGDTSDIEAMPIQGNHKMAKYGLKQHTTITLQDSLINSLEFLDLAHRKITAPLYCAIWRAPLTYWKPFSGIIKLVGRTGSYKSSMAAKALSHFGDFRDNTDLPIKWGATTTAIQIQLSMLRDTLVVIDDYNPEFSKSTRETMGNTLSLILGDSGDGIAKQRANADMTLRESLIVRNLIISTAEMVPSLPESRLARMLIVELSNSNTVDRDKLFNYDPTLNTTIMREYIDWLRTNPPTDIEAIYRKYKDKISGKGELYYERTQDLYANLMIGLVMFDRFLNQYNLKVDQQLYDEVEDALYEICLDQNPVEKINPADTGYTLLFFEGVRDLINEGKAHLKPVDERQGSILGNDRKDFIGFYVGDMIYLKYTDAITLVNQHRFKVGLTEIPARLLASELKNRGIVSSNVYRLSNILTVRACKIPETVIFN
jgi:hypothetical protein